MVEIRQKKMVFEPGSISYRVGLAISAIALALGTVSQVTGGIAAINTGNYVMGILLLVLGAMLGFGTYFNTVALMNDMRMYQRVRV